MRRRLVLVLAAGALGALVPGGIVRADPAIRASASYVLPMPWALKTTQRVRQREVRNAFHLRGRIGGAFKVFPADCFQQLSAARWRCGYEAAAFKANAAGEYIRCSIRVVVRLRPGPRRVKWRRNVAWRRNVTACAPWSGGAP